MYSNITEEDFKKLKKTAIKIKDIVTEFKEKPETPRKLLLPRLNKVDNSITRCRSDSIFDTLTITEPSIDAIIDSNGKDYLIWSVLQDPRPFGGRKSLAKKSRRRRRKTRRSIRK